VPHLRSVALNGVADDGAFPFNVPAIRTLPDIEIHPSVTLLVGENGSGKSTLLEAIAAAANLPAVGATETSADPTLDAQRDLAASLLLTWNRRTHRGFFLRAEDFFGFQKRVAKLQQELQARIKEVDATYIDRSGLARGLAKGPAVASLADIRMRYGENPDARSHGEAFLNLFHGRFVPGGLYLLDEPEAALSPQSQIGLLALLLHMVHQNAQFIIATHSPILLAYPGARIYSFDHQPVETVEYVDVEHVKLTRDFLNDPGRFIRQLG